MRMSINDNFEVYVLSVRKPLPRRDATDGELSAFSQLTLKPISILSEQVAEIYAGPEYQEGGYYHRHWAILANSGVIANIHLNWDIFTLRRVTASETFAAKYRDLKLSASDIEE